MQQQWYYRLGKATVGPVSPDQLQRLVDAGRLTSDSQVIGDGMSDWVTIRALDKPRPPVAPAPSTPVERADNPSTPSPAVQNSRPRRRPPIRRSRRAGQWPLLLPAILSVAVLAATLGWFAGSVSQPRQTSHSKGNANGEPNGPMGRNAADVETGRRPSSRGEVPRDRPAPQPVGDVQGPASVGLPQSVDQAEIESQPAAAGFSASGQTDSVKDAIESRPASPRPAPRVQPGEKPAKQLTDPSGLSMQSKPIVVFQELNVERLPKFSVLGTVMAQSIHYRILSELSVGEPDVKGFQNVSQVVKETQLVKADDLSRSMFEASLKRLKGWQFSYTLNSRREVIGMRGPDDGKKFAPVEPVGGQGFLITSVMDEDGWKELAELTFFQPDADGMNNQSWSRQITHDYDPLGSWYGETRFVPQGKQQDLIRIDFTHRLSYKPPPAGAAVGGLPLTINNADFEALVAGGIIYFDRQSNRVQSAQERFHVRGTLGTAVLGQAANVAVEEQQTITVRVFDQNPGDGQD